MTVQNHSRTKDPFKLKDRPTEDKEVLYDIRVLAATIPKETLGYY